MIICNLQGGFGNHLLCYSSACILADKFKKKIYLRDNIINNDILIQRNDTRSTIYKVINNEYITKNYNTNNSIRITNINQYLNILNSDIPPTTIIIDIIGLDLEFYIKHIEILKKYLIINNIKNPNSIIISLRLGMGENEVAFPSPFSVEINGLRLPFEYYKKSIDYFLSINPNINKLIICSDNFTDNYINNFNNINNLDIIRCSDKNTLEQFEYIVGADYFISSNSSFSLFGGILNTNGIITIPNFKESNAVYPGECNKNYANVLNINLKKCIKIII